jgi:hypothetical protein
MRVILLIVLNTGFIFAIYFFLTCGEAAQRTYTYSVLREMETNGALTNVDLLTTTSPGNKLLNMNPLKQFHVVILGSLLVWTIVVTFFYVIKKSPPPKLKNG